MAMNLAEKIIARAAGRASVTPGEVIMAQVDLAMMHDSGGPRRVQPMLQRLNAKVWDPAKVAVVTDHYVPAVDAETAGILDLTRKWVKSAGIEKFYDMQGICHVVLPERGLLRPGMFVVGGDSHSPTGGAFGCFMFGIGATEMTSVLVRGEIWLKVPQTILLNWSGKLGRGVVAKDMMLALCAHFGMGGGGYQVVQFAGAAIAAMPMTERMTLCNMTAELGAQTGLIAPDAVTAAYLREVAAVNAASGAPGWPDATPDIDAWQADAAASYSQVFDFDAAALEPQVAAPHSPANAGPASRLRGTVFNQAYIGACTGAKLVDLHAAAEVLRGRKVAKDVRLLIAPASARITAAAAADGTLAALTAAGALLLPSGCGACAGYGAGILAEDEVCIASTARNFKGRMGASSAQIYLGSPYTVAASAVAGFIIDPREILETQP